MQPLNPSEISSLIKKQIGDLDTSATAKNEGTIVMVSDGIVRIHGLADAMYGEMIEFDGGLFGMALNLEQDSVGVVVSGNYLGLQEGQKARCTGRVLEVPVGPELLGRVVDALGNPIDGKGPIDAKLTDAVEKVAPGVIWRQSVDQPVQTGYKSVDTMIPVGRGQRELIIGDRQTGKTAMAIDAIIAQKNSGIKCIYVAVGQKQSTIANVVRKLEETGAMAYTTVVAAAAADPAAMLFLAPYSGCTMGDIHKSIEYEVSISSRNNISIYNSHRKVPITKVVPSDGYKYCFTVPSHMLVLRRKDKIFITGNCGKTSSVMALLQMIEDNGLDYLCVSPTGRAAKRLSEQTGRKAYTIHKVCMGDDAQIAQDVIIVDEVSMLSLGVCDMLFSTISNPSVRLVFVGDSGQLSPIGLGRVFRDIINSNIV